jgi:hypothetical protein
MDLPRLLTETEAAEFLGIRIGRLRYLRQAHRIAYLACMPTLFDERDLLEYQRTEAERLAERERRKHKLPPPPPPEPGTPEFAEYWAAQSREIYKRVLRRRLKRAFRAKAIAKARGEDSV